MVVKRWIEIMVKDENQLHENNGKKGGWKYMRRIMYMRIPGWMEIRENQVISEYYDEWK